MAIALDAMGVGPGERVAIVSPNSARFLISYFGVSGFGRVLVPINFRLNADEVAYIVEHSGATVLLVDPELDDALSGVRPRCGWSSTATTTPSSSPPHQPAAARPGRGRRGRHLLDQLHVGNHGPAQRVSQLTHRNCWLNAASFGWHTTVSDARHPAAHPAHVPLQRLGHALRGDGHGRHATSCVRKVDGEEILDRIEDEGVTLLCGAPAVVAAILGAAAERGRAGRRVPGRGRVRMVVAGAPPPSKTIERIETELGWEFIQIYGLTETAPLLTINRAPSEWDGLDAADRGGPLLGRAGVPAVGVRIRVDEEGEVLARSNHVFAGYWEQPEESAAALDGGWFHTGDGGYLDGAYTVISDRKKDVIITGGENVSSIEVEDCLYQHPAVAEVAVIGVPDEKWGETVKALVVVRGGRAATEAELIEHCRARMAHFKAPTSVEIRDALVRTATGKLQKYKLRQPYWEGRDRGRELSREPTWPGRREGRPARGH